MTFLDSQVLFSWIFAPGGRLNQKGDPFFSARCWVILDAWLSGPRSALCFSSFRWDWWGLDLARMTPSGFFLFFRLAKLAGSTHAFGPLSGSAFLSSGKMDPLGPLGWFSFFFPSYIWLRSLSTRRGRDQKVTHLDSQVVFLSIASLDSQVAFLSILRSKRPLRIDISQNLM